MADDKQAEARRLAMSINPSAHVNHKLKVMEGMQHGDAVYIKGDEIEVNRFEAADLLSMFPKYFDPVDELSKKLRAAIAGGGS